MHLALILLGAVLLSQLLIIKRMSALQDAIDANTAAATAETTVIQSAITYIQGIPGLIQAAVDAALAQGATADQLQQLADLKTRLETDATNLNAVLTANVPTPPTP